MTELLPAEIFSSDFGAGAGVECGRGACDKGPGSIPSSFSRSNPFFSEMVTTEPFRVSQMTTYPFRANHQI